MFHSLYIWMTFSKTVPTLGVIISLYFSHSTTATAAKSLQPCPTLCDPIDVSPPGSPVFGILQARTLERVAISFSNEWKWKVKVKSLSRLQLLATPWTAVYQALLSTGFSRQEYWSGVPLPSHSKRCLFLHYWLHQSHWLCGSWQSVENFERDGYTRPPNLLLDKSVCRSGSNS